MGKNRMQESRGEGGCNPGKKRGSLSLNAKVLTRKGKVSLKEKPGDKSLATGENTKIVPRYGKGR